MDEYKCKPIPNRCKYKVQINTNEITYEYNEQYPTTLDSFRVPQLKSECRKYKLPSSRTKPVLIAQLERHFKSIFATITIQRYYRGHIAYGYCRSRGPINGDFVNDTDFITMEPIDDIPWYSRYSIKDKKDVIYVFDIVSLIQSLQITPALLNPYTREPICSNEITNMVYIYNITILLCDEFRKTNTMFHRKPAIRRSSGYRPSRIYDRIVNDIVQNANSESPVSSIANYTPRVSPSSIQTDIDANRLHSINTNRRRPVLTRIHNLFVELDRLGNYTHCNWFVNLSHYDYIRLYRALYGIWNYRAELSLDLKMKICPFYMPFDGLFSAPIYQNSITYTEIKQACLIVMENMVYSGIEEEHRQIGGFHVLTGLTLVSNGARNAMPWLYESIIA